MPPVRMIRCDCGFEASGDGDDLVLRAETHARDAHGVDLPAALVLRLTEPPAPEAAIGAPDGGGVAG